MVALELAQDRHGDKRRLQGLTVLSMTATIIFGVRRHDT